MKFYLNDSFQQPTRKRKRTQPDRLGQNSADENKDGYFEDESGTSGSTYSPSESEDDDQTSETSSSKSIKKPALRTQMSRMEAKLDGVFDVMKQIQRMIISLTTNSSSVDASGTSKSYNFHSFFPIKIEESMDKFELDLNDIEFRQAVVSTNIFFVLPVRDRSVFLLIFFVHSYHAYKLKPNKKNARANLNKI